MFPLALRKLWNTPYQAFKKCSIQVYHALAFKGEKIFFIEKIVVAHVNKLYGKPFRTNKAVFQKFIEDN
ncbi:hypothetical protein ABD72_20670 [Brevibacillus laterosporus]|nr:hypothetical protein BrL25_18185 [Brevibacillus laterosporus DSM 25]MBG9804511.1 hypothetical protein [Brevibacillus laterosporus]